MISKIISSIANFRAGDRHLVDSAGRIVPLQIVRHARAKGYRLRIGRDGAARLTMPARGSEKRAVEWAATQGTWIAAQLDRMEGGGARLADGAVIQIEGRPVTIVWRADLPRRVTLDGDRLIVGGPADHLGDRVLRWLRARAKTVLTEETMALAGEHGLRVTAVGIGDPASRWGSCSASGAIRYSWRLILAPPEVRISTVAHEVAHLKHLDHSPPFHAFHRAICPSDTVAAKVWLRENGAGLHGVRA